MLKPLLLEEFYEMQLLIKCSQNMPLNQGLGTFLVKKPWMSHIKKYCSTRTIQLDIGMASALSSSLTPEDDTSGNFGNPFWKYSLSCNALKLCLLRFV